MKRLVAPIVVLGMNAAFAAVAVLEDAGYECAINHELVDVDDNRVAIDCWRDVPDTTGEEEFEDTIEVILWSIDKMACVFSATSDFNK